MDITEIEERLLKRPETYRSLLGDAYGRNTQTLILKRKMLKNVQKGFLFGSMKLSGTRGGQVLFYHLEKTYSVVISTEYMNFNYFYCDSYKYIDRVTLRLINPHKLENSKWKKIGNELEIFIGNIIKVM